MKTIFAILAVASAGFVGTAASAATCGADIAGLVGPSSACETGSVNNDFVKDPLQVNIDGIFGGGWDFVEKDDADDGLGDGTILKISGDVASGTWDILNGAYAEYMIVMKGGGGRITPDVYVGYLLTALSGDYDSPFSNANNGNVADISHITLYGRGSGPVGGEVPLPAAGWMLLAGLGGIAAMRRRK